MFSLGLPGDGRLESLMNTLKFMVGILTGSRLFTAINKSCLGWFHGFGGRRVVTALLVYSWMLDGILLAICNIIKIINCGFNSISEYSN